jgi:hypothetical protein
MVELERECVLNADVAVVTAWLKIYSIETNCNIKIKKHGK